MAAAPGWTNTTYTTGSPTRAFPSPGRAGDAVVFDGLCFHTPGRNDSGHDRPSITLGYRAVDELDCGTDPADQILVVGADLYRGNN